MMGNNPTEVCIGEVKISEMLHRSNEVGDWAVLKIIATQVQVVQIFQVQQRRIQGRSLQAIRDEARGRGYVCAYVCVPKVEFNDISGRRSTAYAVPFAAVVALPRRESTIRVRKTLFELDKGLSFGFNATSSQTSPRGYGETEENEKKEPKIADFDHHVWVLEEE